MSDHLCTHNTGTVLSAWSTLSEWRHRDWTLLSLAWRGWGAGEGHLEWGDGKPRKTECLVFTVAVLTPFPGSPPLPSHLNETAMEDILPLPSHLSFLTLIVSEHPQGSRHSLISFHLTPLACLQEGAKGPEMQEAVGGHCGSGPFRLAWFVVNGVPFPNISFSELPRFLLQQHVLQRLTKGTLWTLKKQFLSLLVGCSRKHTKAKSICSNCPQGYKSPRGERHQASYQKLFGMDGNPLPGGFRDRNGCRGWEFLSILLPPHLYLFGVLHLQMQQETHREHQGIWNKTSDTHPVFIFSPLSAFT